MRACAVLLRAGVAIAVVALVAGCGSSDPEPWVVYQWGAPCAQEAPGAGLCLTRPDGSDARPILTDVPGRVVDPDWSPDGTTLAFVVVGDDGVGRIWTSAADGSGAKQALDTATRCPAEARFPAWSPDGTRLAFGCFHPDPEPIELAIADLETGEVTTVWTAGRREQGWNPRWSPDGSSLVFELEQLSADRERTTGTGLAIVPTAGGTARRITPVSMFATYPDWSPDGERIVFSTYGIDSFETGGSGASNLSTVRPDGTDLQAVTRYAKGGPRAGHPSWTPDGERIVFTRITENAANGGYGERRIAFVDPDGTNLTVIEDLWSTHPREQPGPS